MNYDSQAAIIANDLDSLAHRIEALQAHPEFTKAVTAVLNAKFAINTGRADIHQSEARARFAVMDGAAKPLSDRHAVGE